MIGSRCSTVTCCTFSHPFEGQYVCSPGLLSEHETSDADGERPIPNLVFQFLISSAYADLIMDSERHSNDHYQRAASRGATKAYPSYHRIATAQPQFSFLQDRAEVK